MSTQSDSTFSAMEKGDRRVGAGIPYDRFLDCVHCGLCTSACPTYLETGDENNSPRGRIYLMRAVTDGRLELTDKVQQHLDLCLDCRSCETACPSGVQYGRLIEPFRVESQQVELGKSGRKTDTWFQKYVMYGLFPYAGRMRWALWPARVMQQMGLDRILDSTRLTKLLPEKLQRMYSQLPRLRKSTTRFPEMLPAIGPKRARVALFTGCVADAMFGQTNWATARVLRENGCEVVVPRLQNCCGAIHYHSGADAPAMELAKLNAKAFAGPDIDAVIVNVAGCGSMLKDYAHIALEIDPNNTLLHEEFSLFSDKVRDVSEFLMQLGPIAPRGELKMRGTYHDACHLVHAQKIREQPRSLLSLIPGLEIVPLGESEICCGAAGSYNLTQPEMSERLAQRKLDNILAVNPQVVITSNAGCSLQIQASLKRGGHQIQVVHPMDLLDLSYRGLQLPGVTG